MFSSSRFLASAALAAACATLAHAQPVAPTTLPDGGRITAGEAALTQQGNSLIIDQATQRLITEWNAFSIGADGVVRFNQPGADAVALNRVVGGDASQLLGSLQANGRVFLVNPNGVYFGAGASVDVGGIVASTLALSDADFLAGNYTFTGGNGAGAIVNDGTLSARNGGVIAFISPRVTNNGELTAEGGSVALAAGDKVTLDFKGDGLINLSVDAAAVDAQVVNRGLIKTDGGLAILSARAAGDLTGSVVNNSGILEANTLVARDGRILLDGGDLGVVENAGSLLAVGNDAGATGGEIIVTGEKVGLFGDARVDASGQAGGGRIAIGGGFQGNDASIANAQRTFVGSDARVQADAIQSGKGGEVIVWSDGLTRFQGTASARGGAGSGDGGIIEISGKGFLEMVGLVDAGAAHGRGGSVLFDPKNIVVHDSGGALLTEVDAFADNLSGDSIIAPGTITAATNAGTTVVLQANNDITINSSIFTTNASGVGGALTFHAGRSITINSNIYSDDANVSFVLNDAAATGAQRDAGEAVFTNNSLIDAGEGNVSITMSTGSTSGAISTGQITAKDFSITHNGGTAGAAAGKIDLGELTITGDLNIITSSARDVVNTVGNILVLGTTTIDSKGGDVTLTRATTDLNIGAFTNVGNVTLNDANAFRFGTSNIAGNLVFTSKGPVASTGAITVAGTASLTATSGGFGYADPYINLSNNNDFQGGLTLSVASSGASGTGGYAIIKDINGLSLTSANLNRYLTINAGGAVDLGPTTVGSDLTVSTTGAITDSGTLIVPNYAQFTADAANDITLDSAANNFNYLRIGSGKDVVINDTNALVFGYSASSFSTISGNLSVTAGGNISQHSYSSSSPYDSRLLVTGDTLFTVTAANSNLFLGYSDPLNATYAGLANSFGGSVTIAKSGAGSYQDVYLRNTSTNAAQIIGLATVGTLQNVSLRYDNAASVEIPGMTLTGNLSISAPNGGITQSGALVVPGTAMFRASSTKDITLTNAANNFYRINVNGARDVFLTDLNAIELYGNGYSFSLSRNLSVTAGGAITDASSSDANYYINVNGGTATFNAGAGNNITLDNQYNQFSRVDITSGNNVTIYDNDSIVFGNSTISGAFLVDSRGSGTLTQVADTAITSGAATFNNFTGGITLSQPNNVFGNIALSSDTGTVNIRENDAITQASAWNLSTYFPAVTLTTSNDQAITLDNASNRFGNLTITQIANGNLTPGAVSIRENDTITQGSAWTTHGATTLNSGAYSIALTNANNVLGPLQVSGAATNGYNITVWAKETAGKAAIYDAGAAGAWSTGTGADTLVSLVGYDATGTTAGAGDIFLTQTGNVLGNLYVRGNDVTITDSTSLTDGATPWITTGVTTLNAGSSSIVLDNLSNSLGAIAIGGTPSSVLITDNTDLTQASAWTIGTAPVTLDARNHHIDLSTSGNVLGNIHITTTNGVPLSVKITENDAITQGSTWVLNGVPVTLVAENDKAITLTNASNILGNLTVTGGTVSIRENDTITQGGAWTTTGTTTLNAATNAITLNNTSNVLGALAFGGTPSAISITENSDITQAAAWNLTSTPITLNSQSHDILLTQASNQLGDLTLTGQNVSVTENHVISDGGAWTVPGLTTLTAGTNAIVLDANPKSDFGTVKIVSASAADITDANGLIFDTSSITSTLTVTAGGAITQIGPIVAQSLLLVGTGNATLTNVANNIVNLAAGFSGGSLAYTDADNFTVAVINGTTGVNIGANDVSLTSVAGTVNGLTSVNPISSSLAVSTGSPLVVPQMTIAGSQSYTSAAGIQLTAGITSTSSGAITFDGPVTLGSSLSIQSTNSAINFRDTLVGGLNQLTLNAGSGLVNFDGAVSNLGNTSSANTALQITSGGATFFSTLSANNGLSVSGPVTFLDDVTFADGNIGSIFTGLVTLGKAGGMTISGYDGLNFNGGVLLQNGPATIRSNNSALVFQGANTVSGPFGLTLDAGTAQITGLDHLSSDLTSLSVTSSTPVIPTGGISVAGPQSYTATAGTSITLNGNVVGTAAGSILFNSPVLLGASISVVSANSPITFASTVDGAHDLSLASGSGLKTFSGRVGNSTPLGDGTGYALTIGGGGMVTFADTLNTASGIAIFSPVTFTKNVTLGDGSSGTRFDGAVNAGGLTISGYDNIAFLNSLTLTGALSVDSHGSNLSFSSGVSGPHALAIDIGAGAVSGLGGLSSSLTGLTVDNTSVVTLPAISINGPQTYNGPVSITGALTGTALSFNKAATLAANNLELVATSGAIAFADAFTLGSHNLTLTANEIDFGAALTGTGAFTLRPYATNANVVLGGALDTGALDLTAADLAWLPATFSNLVIGRADGTGTLAVSGATNFGSIPVTLHGGGGISQSAALTTGALTLRSNAGIDFSNTNNSFGAITLTGTPSLVKISEADDITQGAAWVLDSAPVTLNAGTNAITLTESANTFGALALTGGNVQIVENASTDLGASNVGTLSLTSAGALQLSGPLAASGNVALTAAGPMTQTAPLSIAGNLALVTTHAGGDVTFNNTGASATALGNSLIGGNFVLTATGDNVSQAALTDLQVAGDLTISSASATLDGAGNLVQGTTSLPGVNTVLRQSGVITLGDITEAGNYTVISEATNRSFASGPISGAAITLNNTGNSVGGTLSINTQAPSITTGADVQTGIVQTPGTRIIVNGTASFTAGTSSAGSLGIQLTNTGNQFGSLRLSGSDIVVRNDASNTILAGVNASSLFSLTGLGAITQTGAVVAPQLSITTTGPITLDRADNNTSTLALNGAGAAFRDVDGFAIGSVGGLSGINAGGQALSLQAGGDITQTEAIVGAASLTADAGGQILLAHGSNTIDSLGAVSAQGSVRIDDSAGGLSVTAPIASATGDITVRSNGDITLASGTSVAATVGDIVFSTEGAGEFINQAGAGVFTVGSGKRWLVYSKTPDLVGDVHTEKGGLTSAFRLYGKTYASDAPGSISLSGNGFIYATAGSNTLSLRATIVGAASHVYGDTPTGSLGYIVSSGFLDSEDDISTIGLTGTALYSGVLDNTLNAGAHTFSYLGGLSSPSYTLLVDDTAVSYTVTTAPLTYVAHAASRAYGDVNPAFGGTLTGFKLGQDISVLTGSPVWSSAATVTDGVGQYAITGSGYSSSNYHFVQAAGNSTALTITPRAITLTADAQSRVYGNANPTTGAFTLGGAGLVNGDTLASLVDVSSNATLTSGVGNYTLTPSSATFTQGSASNYSISYANGTLTITPRAITITPDAQSRVYGNANPTTGAFTVGGAGLVNGDTLASLVNVTSDATLTSNVGNYLLSASSATFTQGSASNYTISYADGALTVTPRAITLTADAQSRAYGDANPLTGAFSVGGAGLVNGDTLASLVDVSSNATLTSNVGNYTLTPSSATFTQGSASNYTISYADGLLTVTPRAIVLTPDAQSRVYGDANPTSGSFTIGGAGLVNGDTLASSIHVATPALITSNVGAYVLTGSGANFTSGSASNYQITYAPSTLNVTPATLFYTATPQSRVYGDANPVFGGTVVGFRNGDTLASATTGTLQFASSADVTSSVGAYAIDGSGLDALNYVFAQATTNGTALTITPRPITVTIEDFARFYGDADPATTAATAFNLVNGDTLGSVGFVSTATISSGVGSYTVTPTSAIFATGSASNYQIQYTSGTLTIAPRPLTITAVDQSRAYGDANPIVGAVIADNLANGDALGLSAVTSSATPASGVGAYSLMPGLAAFTHGSSANYAITYQAGSLTITPRAITITANDQSRVYGGANPTTGGFALTQGTLVNGDALDSFVSVSSNATAASNVGNYALTPGAASFVQGSAANYAITYADGALTITPATLTYVATPVQIDFGSPVPAVSGSVVGFVNGDTLTSATSGVLAWTTPATFTSVAGAYEIVGSGLVANHGNYVFLQAPENATALTITERQVSPDLGAVFTKLENVNTQISFGEGVTITGSFGSDPGAPTFGVQIVDNAGFGAGASDSAGFFGTTAAPSADQAANAPMTLVLGGDDQSLPSLAVYSETGDTVSAEGSFSVNDGGSMMSIVPNNTDAVAFPASFDVAGARRADATIELAGDGQVRVTAVINSDGYALIEVPADFFQKRGAKGATIAGLLALKRELGIPASAVKAVKVRVR